MFGRHATCSLATLPSSVNFVHNMFPNSCSELAGQIVTDTYPRKTEHRVWLRLWTPGSPSGTSNFQNICAWINRSKHTKTSQNKPSLDPCGPCTFLVCCMLWLHVTPLGKAEVTGYIAFGTSLWAPFRCHRTHLWGLWTPARCFGLHSKIGPCPNVHCFISSSDDKCSCCRSRSPSWASAACTRGCSCSRCNHNTWRCKGGVRCWRSHQPEEWPEDDKHEEKTESNHQETQDGGSNASASGSHDQEPIPRQESSSEHGERRGDVDESASSPTVEPTPVPEIAQAKDAIEALCLRLRVGMYQWPTKDHQTPVPNVCLRVGSSVDVRTTQLLQVFGSSSRSIVKYCECNLHK